MNYEPKIIGFTCNWCTYAAADLAGASRMQYPPNIRLVRVMCSGMVHPKLVVDFCARCRRRHDHGVTPGRMSLPGW